jgi:hypothetical protein
MTDLAAARDTLRAWVRSLPALGRTRLAAMDTAKLCAGQFFIADRRDPFAVAMGWETYRDPRISPYAAKWRGGTLEDKAFTAWDRLAHELGTEAAGEWLASVAVERKAVAA